MNEEQLGLFNGEELPTHIIAYEFYKRCVDFNNQINLDETVRVNENFYVGKQWEGVQSNGLPTPQVNILKRVVGFTVATISSENIKFNATALSRTKNTKSLTEPVRIINDELDGLVEINEVPAIMRESARNAAVDGDGCTFTYWDADVDIGDGLKGAIKTEIINNRRVYFGNPNDKEVQSQPYIQIVSRGIVRDVKKRAKGNGIEDWMTIAPDDEESYQLDNAKRTDDKVTVILTLWRNDEDGEIWAYESTQYCDVKKPWSLGIRLYPITWLNWDSIQDCYHGQAMITGLIPNQIFINKSLAMSQLSIMRTAFPKIVFDKTKIKSWDNRVGAAIGVGGGDINNAAKIIDPAAISPQISQFIQMTVELTEQSLGATSVALGDTRPDNTSAIIALQRAAATPSEITKQALYRSVEQLAKIYLEFMAQYYGTRMVDMPTPPEVRQAAEFAGVPAEDEIVMPFDFSALKDMPMRLKIDVGASSYYSEIASRQTLDNLLMNHLITLPQYLERIPDSYVPGRRALINEAKQAESAQAQMMMPQQAGANDQGTLKSPEATLEEMEVPAGKGNHAMQRQINNAGSTEGIV